MGVDISVIWFAIIVFATLMYIIMDGFDLGGHHPATTGKSSQLQPGLLNQVGKLGRNLPGLPAKDHTGFETVASLRPDHSLGLTGRLEMGRTWQRCNSHPVSLNHQAENSLNVRAFSCSSAGRPRRPPLPGQSARAVR